MADLEVRDLTGDDREAARGVRHRSFGPLSSAALAWWNPLYDSTVAARRALGVLCGTELVAMARIHPYRQLWGGRSLPMAGIAGVVVAPEWRGRGVATLLMRATMRRAVELGDVLSVLYPAALPPYRKIGYEVAGTFATTTFPASALRQLGVPSIAVRRPTEQDAQAIADLMRGLASEARASGPLEVTADDVRELIADDDMICYLADDGFVAYSWDGEDLRVEQLVAGSPDTARDLWALVGSGASAVRNVMCWLPASDPVHWIVAEQAAQEVRRERWMLRLLDVRRAVAERGFPAGLTITVPLEVTDPELADGARSYDLRVADGRGELHPSPARQGSCLQLGPNGLAALYAGTKLATLRASGLVAGGSLEADALLDAAFAASPYLIDRF